MAFQVDAAVLYLNEKVEYSGSQFELKYPTIQWSYGDPKLATRIGGADAYGGWFLPEGNIPVASKDQIIAAIKAAGWVEETISTQKNGDISGFYTESITLAHIANRKRWYGEDSDDRKVYGDWGTIKNRFGKAKSQFQVMALLKGLESVGPFVITLKVSAAMAFEGTKTEAGALTHFLNTVIKKADDAAKKELGIKDPNRRVWSFREFWLTVGIAKDAKGNVLFKTYGEGKEASHLSIPVAIGIPSSPDLIDLDIFAVGSEFRDSTKRMYDNDAVPWVEEWKKVHEEQAAPAPTQNNTAATAAFAAANGLN